MGRKSKNLYKNILIEVKDLKYDTKTNYKLTEHIINVNSIIQQTRR